MHWHMDEWVPNNFIQVLGGFAFIILNSSPRIFSLVGFDVGGLRAGGRNARGVKTVTDLLGKSPDDYSGDV